MARRVLTSSLGRRLGQLVVVLAGVSFLTFIMLNLLPGDPAIAVLGEDASNEAIAAFRAEHELDRHVLVRYVDWAGGAAVGDFGTSYRSDQDVLSSILDRVPVSLELVVLAQLMSLALAVPAAVYSVWRRNTFSDRAINLTAFASLSIPTFLFAYVAIIVFAVQLGWFPATGFTRVSDGLVDNLRTAFLPALTLALPQYGIYLRVLRSEMFEALGKDYVTTAVGKGLVTRRVMTRHVLRSSLLSLVTVVGVNIGTLLGGSVITESIFAIPGVGRLMMEGISQRDLMVVQGVVLFAATVYVVLNLAVDLLYSVLDPRIRSGGSR